MCVCLCQMWYMLFVSDVVHAEVMYGILYQMWCMFKWCVVFVSDVVHVEVGCKRDLQVTNESLETSL